MANTSALLQQGKPWSRASELPSSARDPIHAPLLLPSLKPLFNKGLSRGSILEVSGRRSAGRATVCLHILAEATRRGEVCAVVDATDSFAPDRAELAGVCLCRVLWIRCAGNPEHAMRAADLLLHAGGFGVVWLDLCELPNKLLNRIPISYWHRFRRTLENTPAILMACFDVPQVKSIAINRLELQSESIQWTRDSRFSSWQSMPLQATLRQSFMAQQSGTWWREM